MIILHNCQLAWVTDKYDYETNTQSEYDNIQNMHTPRFNTPYIGPHKNNITSIAISNSVNKIQKSKPLSMSDEISNQKKTTEKKIASLSLQDLIQNHQQTLSKILDAHNQFNDMCFKTFNQ